MYLRGVRARELGRSGYCREGGCGGVDADKLLMSHDHELQIKLMHNKHLEAVHLGTLNP